MFRLLALALLFTAGIAQAQPQPPGDRPPPPHQLIIDHADEIGLTAETVERIDAIIEDLRPDRDASREERHEIGRQIMDEIRAELTRAQWEKAREFLPPPPEERDSDRGRERPIE